MKTLIRLSLLAVASVFAFGTASASEQACTRTANHITGRLEAANAKATEKARAIEARGTNAIRKANASIEKGQNGYDRAINRMQQRAANACGGSGAVTNPSRKCQKIRQALARRTAALTKRLDAHVAKQERTISKAEQVIARAANFLQGQLEKNQAAYDRALAKLRKRCALA